MAGYRWTEADVAELMARRAGQKAKAEAPSKPAKPSKYRNVRTTVDQLTFDSKREAERWTELQLLQKAGEITNLRRQVEYALVVSHILVARYFADFCYVENGVEIVEDVKSAKKSRGGKKFSTKTDVYRIKFKLMLALYGIQIREIE